MRRASSSALSVVLAAGLLAGCGDDESSGPEGDGTPSDSATATASGGDDDARLTYTRDDGSTFDLSDFGVTCRKSSTDDKTEVVRMTSPAKEAAAASTKPFFYAEVVPGTTGELEIPVDSGFVRKTGPVLFFTYDPQDQNELSADQEEGSGTITILEATCDPVPALSFEIDGTVGSEYGDLPELEVTGAASGVGS